MGIRFKKTKQELHSLLTNVSLITKLNIHFVLDDPRDSFAINHLSKSSPFINLDLLKVQLTKNAQILPVNDMMIFTDNTPLSYLAISCSFLGKEAFIVLGPFLTKNAKHSKQQTNSDDNTFTLNDHLILKNNDNNLILVLEDEYLMALASILRDLLDHPNGLGKGFSPSLHKNKPAVDLKAFKFESTLQPAKNQLVFEKDLMYFISQGHLKEALETLSSLEMALNEVTQISLRTNKNNALILNTKCQVAADYGGALFNQVQEKFRLFMEGIEEANGIFLLKQLRKDMVIAYCKLVNQSKFHGLSKSIILALEYINSHLSYKITLKNISEHAKMNESYLSRQFKKETGKNISDYINEKRILLAKHHLESTDHSIATISKLCGFKNYNYFSKVFKDYTGQTPKEFQKNLPLREERL